MADFTLSRSTHVDAEPSTVHALIDDFHEWVNWSPWEGLDPQLERTYSGPAKGTGARYAWSGNRRAGQGSMAITRSTPDAIDVDVDFVKPFKASNQVAFDLPASPQGGTDVTWTMRGTRGPVGAIFGRLIKIDDHLMADFDTGLLALKSLAETRGR